MYYFPLWRFDNYSLWNKLTIDNMKKNIQICLHASKHRRMRLWGQDADPLKTLTKGWGRMWQWAGVVLLCRWISCNSHLCHLWVGQVSEPNPCFPWEDSARGQITDRKDCAYRHYLPSNVDRRTFLSIKGEIFRAVPASAEVCSLS